jgi:ATP-binding cassette subfamily E protein 1
VYLYLIEEPSAYLDSEQRINCAKVIRPRSKKTAFVVEYNFIMATYQYLLADRVVIYHGNSGVEATATNPQSLLKVVEKQP